MTTGQPGPAQEKISEGPVLSPEVLEEERKYDIRDAPKNANIDLIGRTVLIQTFERTDDGDTIKPDTLEKLFGVIEAIVLMQDQIIIKLHGCDAESYMYADTLVEIYPKG